MQHLHFRSIWISDTHLGGRNLKSNQLYEFLKSTESDNLYLVGDIFDLWKLRNNWHWPEINDHIVNLIINKAQNGTKVYYLPGNHDDIVRRYTGTSFHGVQICEEIVHTSVDGKRYLVLHGDKFDCVVQNSEWLANIGSTLYDSLLILNRWVNTYRSFRGKDYFSISAWLKHKCKKAVNYIGDFEQVLISEIKKNQVDGLICGHIHHASIKAMGDFLYSNSGDWVESCTALAENSNGTIGIIQWIEQNPVKELTTDEEYEQDRYSDGCLASPN
ncbi:UDP-2,3-diacylglucosamine diphosphatase [Desulfosediminicola ganghwensis]|uniref:UDP-2,3-diacylglucosamine diphosphatase n=1 Tax=Desulfosediminicola ganghwensis TaxID=2569540 RepID=UPI0010ACD794|nr:UDP-2,3-diacylglucosamine diphosphatase [Desulfosediminicola ganghwensis]